ncbi:aminotransferase-like domain-containing protein [Pseudomonas panipatensis]|jgi:DNA-binding transcriptional MocR family regulator|uniref:DNA-binding transcriptional regulator, MocR family, contains an aminotransferase domain n=1 Tax=Pseudomonas panipatensis TaxID=428992 RepID=A0A1G8JUD9_9PSED|nr:PLP-dependent aminotransferase family protein [Pseudomonas panipatensis]SDI34826.1 DNA-binding transcriptional regulator, MocR family, contains an aminotransferase domain [Pseudomonas panipatensis]SMP62186.1 transcriptional regulator, GntR family [Pseudomonas panipatensis]
MKRYARLAATLGQRIEQGLYRPGDRLPSVRALSEEHGVSISTVQQAYRVLEDAGLVEPRPKSGFFVPEQRRVPALPAMTRPAQRPVDISQWDQVLEQVRTSPGDNLIQLGRGTPDISSPSLKPLLRAMANAARRSDLRALGYEGIQGSLPLREQIARLMLDSGCRVPPSEIIVTTGCQEALAITLRAICQPGDIVAIDSPSFHGAMQALKAHGLKALEIPTDPVNGVSLEALELAMEQWPVKLIMLTPNCNNPLGYIMPDTRKRALLSLAQRYDVPILEDDVYGELAYAYPRPRSIKSFDSDDRVLLASSFSKTVAPGLRTGWVVPGRYLERILHLKYIASGTCAPQPQMALAEFVGGGHYEPHIRRMRAQYQRHRDLMSDWVSRYFPDGTRASRPQGGFMLWVELDPRFDSVRLNQALRPECVQVAAGSIFSASGKYRNCLRMNYSSPELPRIEEAVRRVGAAATRLLEETQALESSPEPA